MYISFIAPNNKNERYKRGAVMNKKKVKKKSNVVEEIVNAFVVEDSLKCDPNGSYTGKCADPFSVPVQDQDDL